MERAIGLLKLWKILLNRKILEVDSIEIYIDICMALHNLMRCAAAGTLDSLPKKALRVPRPDASLVALTLLCPFRVLSPPHRAPGRVRLVCSASFTRS